MKLNFINAPVLVLYGATELITLDISTQYYLMEFKALLTSVCCQHPH